MVQFYLAWSNPSSLIQSTRANSALRSCRREAGPRQRHARRWRAELAVFPEAPAKSNAERKAAVELLNERFESSTGFLGDGDVEWFLKDRRYEVHEAEAKLQRVLEFRREYEMLVQQEDVADEMATGKSRVHKHKATRGRPVLLVNVHRHVTSEFPIESTKKLVAYQVRQAMGMLVDGDETIMTMIDMRGFSLRNADIKFVKYLVDVFFIFYPRRMSELLLVSPPLIFRPTWTIIKPLLRKYAHLVKFVKVEEVPDYFEKPAHIPPEFVN